MAGTRFAEGAQVDRSDHAGIVVLRLQSPPVNALTPALRRAFLDRIEEIAADASVRAVVLIGQESGFSRGLDFSETGTVQAEPELSVLCRALGRLGRPVIAALSGLVQGAALELALAADYRIALEGVQIAMPGVRLGLGPVAGAASRLARLAGAGPAIAVICDGRTFAAPEALAEGLVDLVVARGLEERALSFAHDILVGQGPRPRNGNGLADPAGFQAAVQAARERLAPQHNPAPMVLLDCIEAAQLLLPEQAAAHEAIRCEDLARAPQSRALRHAFLAERRALLPPRDLTASPLPVLQHLAIHGPGEALVRPARLALSGGLRVSLCGASPAQLRFQSEAIGREIDAEVEAGRLPAAAAEADRARLSLSPGEGWPEGADIALTDGRNPLPGAEEAPPVLVLGIPGTLPPDLVALWPGPAAGLLAELCTGEISPLSLRRAGLALGRALRQRVQVQGGRGPVSRRLRLKLAELVRHLEARGLDRALIARCLGAHGIGISAAQPLPEAPPEAGPIHEMLVAALSNEGMRCLADGTAESPIHVDAAAVAHGLMAPWEGGPMYQADLVGVMVMRTRLSSLASEAPGLFAPCDHWESLLAEGKSLADLNRA